MCVCKFLNKMKQVLDEWCYPCGCKQEDNLWWHKMWSQSATQDDIQVVITIKRGQRYSITYWRGDTQTTTGASIPESSYNAFNVVLMHVTLGQENDKPLYIEVESDEQPLLTYDIDGTVITDIPMFKK